MRASAPAPHCIGSCLGVGPTEVGEDVAELRGGDEAVAVAIEDLPFEGAVRSGACGRRRVCLFLSCTLNASRISSSGFVSCILDAIIDKNSGKSIFPVGSGSDDCEQEVICFVHVKSIFRRILLYRAVEHLKQFSFSWILSQSTKNRTELL